MADVSSGLKKPIRMTPTAFHILLSVVDGERHGYAIMREVEARTEGRIRLGPGSLYWAIHRLQESGLIEEQGEQAGDERRRYYRLTDVGRRFLAREAEALAEIVAYARAKKVIA